MPLKLLVSSLESLDDDVDDAEVVLHLFIPTTLGLPRNTTGSVRVTTPTSS